MSQKQKDRRKVEQIIGEFFLCLPAVGVCYLLNSWIECIVTLICVTIFKLAYPTKLHFNKNINCIILSYAILICSSLLSLAFGKNSFSITIIISSAVSYLCAQVAVLQAKAKTFDEIKEPYEQLCERYRLSAEFYADCCTKDRLLARCQELGFSKENTDLAVMLFIEKQKHSHIADILCIQEKSVTTRKQRMKALLNKK